MKVLSEKMGFKNVTKVQSAVLPLFLPNKDVCVKACTGSGKTLAFVVPIIERLIKIVNEYKLEGNREENRLPPNRVISIVIAPSRELVIQIYNVLYEFRELFKVEEEEKESPGNSDKESPNPDEKNVENAKNQEDAFWANFSYFIGGDKLDFDL